MPKKTETPPCALDIKKDACPKCGEPKLWFHGFCGPCNKKHLAHLTDSPWVPGTSWKRCTVCKKILVVARLGDHDPSNHTVIRIDDPRSVESEDSVYVPDVGTCTECYKAEIERL